MYDGSHSVTFILTNGDRYNSWKDWFLIPATAPVVAAPTERTSYVTVPGRSGSWDLSQAVAGRPVFDDREGSWEFYVDNGHFAWQTVYSTVMAALQGRRMRVILEDDPSYYYEGAVWVDKPSREKNFSKITLKYRLAPYKKEITDSTQDWVWDSFNFETDVVREYEGIVVDGSYTLNIRGTSQPVYPSIILVSGSLNLQVLRGQTEIYNAAVASGTSQPVLLELGLYQFIFTGTGTVSVVYRGGVF